MEEQNGNMELENSGRGELVENSGDEEQILGDQDETNKSNPEAFDENMGAIGEKLEPLEDEPDDFMQGEIDVKKQMDLTGEAVAGSLEGTGGAAADESPDSELEASFRATPGGIEEVAAKTDEDLARRSLGKAKAQELANLRG